MSLVFIWITIIYFGRTYQIPGPKMHLNYCLFNLVFWLQKWKLYILVSDGKLWKRTISIGLYSVPTKSFLSLVSNSRAVSITFFPWFSFSYNVHNSLLFQRYFSFWQHFLDCCCYCMFKITLVFFFSRQKAKTNNKLMPF